MSASVVGLKFEAREEAHDLAELHAYLGSLIGEPFQFARVSYGDELTLHFGDLRPARSPKLKLLYGAYILGMRASPWMLKPGTEPLQLISSGSLGDDLPANFGERVRKEDLESGKWIEPGSRVVDAAPFTVKAPSGFGLHIRMSDGSAVLVLPPGEEPEEAADADLPVLADWELSTPFGLLSAGPGIAWSFRIT